MPGGRPAKLPEPAKPNPPTSPLPAIAETSSKTDYEFVRILAGDGVAEFEIGKYDVTVAQFRKFVEATGYKTTAETQGWSVGYTGSKWEKINGLNWKFGTSLNDPAQDDHPVVNVSREDAKAFCQWVGGRLPNDDEWEHAARGGLQGRKYQWGDEWPPPTGSGNFADVTAKGRYATWKTIKDYDDGYSDSSPVGAFKPNGFGLYDMAGNVWEWVVDPAVLNGNRCRGGSFASDNQDHLLLVYCYYSNPDASFGFRVARNSK